MAIVKGVRRILKTDFSEAPQWFEKLLVPLNEFMDSAINALRAKLTFRDNFLCDIKTIRFVHNVEQSIAHQFPALNGVLIALTPNDSSDNTIITGFKYRVVSPKVVGVKIMFQGVGTTTGDVKIIILG